MTTSLHCTPTLHAALCADRRAFEAQPYLGLELVGGDVVELRQCTHCGDRLRRPLGIDVRLAQARASRGGIGDQEMIGLCKRALAGDASAVRAWRSAVDFEALMPRAVRL